MSDPRLDGLVDQAAVAERVYRYATGIDTRDMALYRSLFADRVDIDFSSYNGTPPATISADDWVANVEILFTGLDATQHSMTNPIVAVDGDRATCTMYMQAAHFMTNDRGDDEFTIGGYYDDTLIRHDDGWLIDGLKLTVLWSRGNRHIMDLAAALGAERLGR